MRVINYKLPSYTGTQYTQYHIGFPSLDYHTSVTFDQNNCKQLHKGDSHFTLYLQLTLCQTDNSKNNILMRISSLKEN